ncbi:matrixin family metalloprotease [Rhodococcus sp. MS13]
MREISRFSRRRRKTGRDFRKVRNLARTVVIAAGLAGLIASTPGVANADQFRNGHWVFGSIEREFLDFLNAQNQSSIGEPTSDELLAGVNGEGRWQEFGYGNRILWSPNVDMNKGRQVGGLILNKYLTLPPRNYKEYENGPTLSEKRNDERGRLGYPVTRELPAVGGRYNNFQGGGITYKFGATSAYATWGDIRNQWGAQGWETGNYGFPTSDEYLCQNQSDSDNAWELYGASGQNFSNGKYLTSGRRTPTMPAGKDSVVAGSINFVSTSSYTTQIDQAIAAWANQGPIKIKPNDPLNPSYISLEISDTNRPDLKWAGLHHWDPLGVDTLQMNTGTIVSAANARNVMAHEMGHALGFEHNCQSQLMDPRSNSSVFLPQNMDSEAYHSRWGY